MSPVRTAAAPRGPLHRIGRLPDPLAFPPWGAVGSGRFDDPAGRFRVLYAASRRRGAFLESLAPFRPALALLARLRAVAGTADPVPEPRVPADWYRRRGVARLRLPPGSGGSTCGRRRRARCCAVSWRASSSGSAWPTST